MLRSSALIAALLALLLVGPLAAAGAAPRADLKLNAEISAWAAAGIFPIEKPYSYGSSGSRFGAPRPGGPHQGQDISAACGRPLVAILDGQVVANGYHPRAGWHLVVENRANNISLAYIHLQGRSRMLPGQKVIPGKFIGQVGKTGRAFSCHLHFELWRGPWQRSPGYPIDPRDFLQRLAQR
jgi:murein DD-endopeptidase MepM/ murein hydrolase activator NlpD